MLTDYLHSISADIATVIHKIFMQSSSRHYWLYMLCYLLIAVIIYFFAKRSHRHQTSLLSFLFPRKVYTHSSNLLDLQIWILLATIVHLGLFANIGTVALWVTNALEYGLDLLGPSWEANRTTEAPGILDRIWYTILLTFCIDFGFFIMHYFQHRISWLWAFHKVHHSAQVLTPITANRHHPVDYILQATTSILLSVIGMVIFTRFHGTEIDRLTILNTSAIHCVYYMTANFRHSHIWLHFGTWPCKVFVSPAMHMIHHSVDQKHYNKNFGYVFSLWDAIFRCRYIPQKQEDIVVGLHRGEQGYKGLLDALFRPFSECFQSIIKIGRWPRPYPW